MQRDGSRTIELLVPLRGVSSITFRGFTAGDEDDWHDGYFNGPREMMCLLSGHPRSVFRSLRFPDADRVMSEFLLACPESIRRMLSEGNIPTYVGPKPAESEAPLPTGGAARKAAPAPATDARVAKAGDKLAEYVSRPMTGAEAAFMGIPAQPERDSGTGPYKGPVMGQDGEDWEEAADGAGDGLLPVADAPEPVAEPQRSRRPGYTTATQDFNPPEYNPAHAPDGKEYKPLPGQRVFPEVPEHIDPSQLDVHGLPRRNTGMDLRDGE